MKYGIFLIALFSSLAIGATPGGPGSTSTNIMPQLQIVAPTFNPKGQTTSFSGANQTALVQASGSATCPEGTIMVGLGVTYKGSAFTRVGGSEVKGKCKILGSITGMREKNWNPALLTDPTKMDYSLICRPIATDFY